MASMIRNQKKSKMIYARYEALKAQQKNRDGQASPNLARRAAVEYFRQIQIEVFQERRDRYVAQYRAAHQAPSSHPKYIGDCMRMHRELMAA